MEYGIDNFFYTELSRAAEYLVVLGIKKEITNNSKNWSEQ